MPESEEDGVLAVDRAQWFASLLRRVPDLQLDDKLCQDDWGVVVFARRRGKKFWIGLSTWPNGAPNHEVHFPMLGFIKRKIRSVIAEELDAMAWRSLRHIDFGLRLRAILDSAEFVEENIPLHLRFTGTELRQMAIEQAPRDGLFIEFGVWQANWLNKMATWTPRIRWYGFDSFEGLPEPWSIQRAGFFKVQQLPAVRENVTLVKGWFNETLKPFLAEHPEPVSFIHMDCDLYSSTKTVLELLRPRLRAGTTMVLDDFLVEPGWQHQQHKAWREFVEKYDIKWEYLGYQSDLFGSVGVRIR